ASVRSPGGAENHHLPVHASTMGVNRQASGRRTRSGFRRELATRSGDLLPPSVPDGAGHSPCIDPSYELTLDRFRTSILLAARCRVQRNHVHVCQLPEVFGQPLREQVSTPRLVDHVLDHRILDRYPTTDDIRVVTNQTQHIDHVPSTLTR